MNRRARAAMLAAALPATLLLVRPVSVAADSCGGDSGPPCPVVDRVDPSVLQAPPGGPLTVTLAGHALGNVAAVSLLPQGIGLRILAESPAQITVTVPAGALGPGQTYRFQLNVPDVVIPDGSGGSLAVLGGGAQPAAHGKLAPPPVAVDTPRPRPVRVAPVASTAPADDGSALSGLMIWGIGFLVGAVVCLVVAVRTGLLYEMRWFEARRRAHVDRALAEHAGGAPSWPAPPAARSATTTWPRSAMPAAPPPSPGYSVLTGHRWSPPLRQASPPDGAAVIREWTAGPAVSDPGAPAPQGWSERPQRKLDGPPRRGYGSRPD